MPTLSITINCDGAALRDALAARDTYRYTPRPVLDAVLFTSAGTVRDENGNTVGNWTFDPKEDTA